MAEADIRARLYAIVNAVDGTDNVYDYRRWAATHDRVIEIFGTTKDTFLGFDIEAGPATAELNDFPANGGTLRTWNFKVRMYYGHDDDAETEKDAAALIEDVLEAIDSDGTLHDGTTFYYAARAQLDAFDMRFVGGALCHYGEIRVAVTEYIA